MPPTTRGHLLVTPFALHSDLDLDRLLQVINERKPPPGFMETGWGALSDDLTYLTATSPVDFRAGDAQLVEPEGGGNWPRHIRARLYWREADRSLLRHESRRAALADLAGTTPMGVATDYMRLTAADVFISEASGDGEFLAMVSLRNESQLDAFVVPAVESLSEKSRCLTSTSSLDRADEDFFRWLLYRAHHQPNLTSELSIESLRSISGRDSLTRMTDVSEGVDIDRPEVLALIMASGTAFGPVKMVLSEIALGLEADFELRKGGGFSAHMGRSFYEDEDDLTRSNKGPRIVADLAYVVIPDLYEAYYSDASWDDENRQASIESARAALRAALDRLEKMNAR